MKKPLIKALGVILSAAMICGSVPAGVSPALAAEVTEGVSPAPVTEVSAEAAATNEVSVTDTGNEEKESDNSSTDPDDAISVSDNAAEDETGEAAGDENGSVSLDDLMAMDLSAMADEEICDLFDNVDMSDAGLYFANLTEQDLAMIKDKLHDKKVIIYSYDRVNSSDLDQKEVTSESYVDYCLNQFRESTENQKAWKTTKGGFKLSIYHDSTTNTWSTTGVTIKASSTDYSTAQKISIACNNDYLVLPATIKTSGTNNVMLSTDFSYNHNNWGIAGWRLNRATSDSVKDKSTITVNDHDGSSDTLTGHLNVNLTWDANLGLSGSDGEHKATFKIILNENSYTLSYDGNGGAGNVDQQTVSYTDVSQTVKPNGYNKTYTVTYNGDGGTPDVASGTATSKYLGWGLNNKNQVTHQPGAAIQSWSKTNQSIITMYAIWQPGTVVLPSASRTGYHFGGWNTAQGVKGAGTSYTATKDETITAVWIAQGYSVKFISDGKEYGSQSFVYGTAQGLKTLADLQISKPGYTFKGWNGTYTDGQAVKDLTDINNGTVTLTAQWEAKTDTPYTVHRYVQKEPDKTNPETDYVLYEAPEGTENPILGTETKTATTDTSVTEIAVAIPGYDTPDAIGPKTIAGDGSTTFDFYYNLTDTRATLTVNHYYQTSIDGDWVLYDGTFGSITDTTFTNVFHGTIGESMTPEQLSADAIKNYEYAYNYEYTLVPTESPKTVVLTKNSEVNYYYKMVKKNTVVEYKVDHYIQKTPGGNYELFETTIDKAELGSTISPALNQKAIDAVNAIEGCKCEKPQLQVVTITQEGMVFKYNYACVKGTPDVISGGSNLSDETINEIAKKLAAGLSFSMDIDGVTYEIVQNPDGTLAIKFAATTDTKVVIPDVIKIGDKIYRITEVNEKAFKDNTTIREVVISQNVSKIGNSAFEGCTSLEKVTLKEGLVTIGDKAFKGCSSLTSITMPATVQKIGNYAFENCTKLKTVKLNEGLLTIGKKAFYNCKALKKVKIPKSVLKIGSFAFAKCAALTSFTFATDSQLMSMGTGVLSNDKKLTKIKLPGKLTAVPSKAFKNDTKLASVTIGKSVTRIGAEAFNGCKKIKKVTIPTKVQTIGEKAFYNCKSLKTVSIKSKALTSVGEKAFKKCKKGLKLVVPGKKTAAYKKLLNGKY